jgi:hypothetical protein
MATCNIYSMPFAKKSVRDRLSRLNGRLPSPKKAIKRVAAIALSPVKRVEKKHRSNGDYGVTFSLRAHT